MLPGGGQDPRMELGADANTSQVAATNFKGAEHTAKHQAPPLQGPCLALSARDCTARLTQAGQVSMPCCRGASTPQRTTGKGGSRHGSYSAELQNTAVDALSHDPAHICMS